MAVLPLPLHPGLSSTTRLRSYAATTDRVQPWEIAALAAFGAVAAVASAWWEFRLGIPGHAILKAVFPLALGLAVVPRRGAGTAISLMAVLTAVPLHWATASGGGLSLGALTSLAVTGPLLDWTLRRARSGSRAYLGFALAGLAANVLALGARAGGKLLGLDHLNAQPLALWWMRAVVSYAACGLLAGAISAAILFRGRPRQGDLPESTS